MEILTDWRQKKVKDQYPTIQVFFTVLKYKKQIKHIYFKKLMLTIPSCILFCEEGLDLQSQAQLQ